MAPSVAHKVEDLCPLGPGTESCCRRRQRSCVSPRETRGLSLLLHQEYIGKSSLKMPVGDSVCRSHGPELIFHGPAVEDEIISYHREEWRRVYCPSTKYPRPIIWWRRRLGWSGSKEQQEDSAHSGRPAPAPSNSVLPGTASSADLGPGGRGLLFSLTWMCSCLKNLSFGSSRLFCLFC